MLEVQALPRAARVAVAISAIMLGSGFVALGGCDSAQKVKVRSTPAGATIYIDGIDSGEKAPAELELSADAGEYDISVRKNGYNEVQRTIKYEHDVEVITPKKAAGMIICAPFCCGLPLLGFLEPVTVRSKFVPDVLNFNLDPEGEGLELVLSPTSAEVYVDGALVRAIDGRHYLMTPGVHDLEVRAAEYQTYRKRLTVFSKTYQMEIIQLAIGGEGLLISGHPEGARIKIDGQTQEALGAGTSRVRIEPGAHEVLIEKSGYSNWTATVNVLPEIYMSIQVVMQLEGQGIIVRKPKSGAGKHVSILVNNEIYSTTFDAPIALETGSYDVQVRIDGNVVWYELIRITEGLYLEIHPRARE